MEVSIAVNPHFENFVFDWDYEKYLLVGGYGSSKSWHVAFKIINKCLEEKRKVLVVREVYETIRESCFDLFCEILDNLGLLAEEGRKGNKRKVKAKASPLQLTFPNGSKIIFRGMDKPRKLKSINGVSIVWVEECSEVKYEGFKEILGRARHPKLKIHFILSTNPVDEQNWVYKHFFIDEEEHRVVLQPERLYKKRIIVKNGVYYHHSTVDDNMFVQKSYIKTIDEIKEYDPDLWRVARKGQFGANGTKVLPQIEKMSHLDVVRAVRKIPDNFLFNGMDFGFEVSYNAVIRMAVDDDNKWLYIWWEYYKNKQTDDVTAEDLSHLRDVVITADSEDPKAIQYFKLSGFRMRKCHKFPGSRLANTKKVKRFKRIIISDACPMTYKELKTLTYKKDANGNTIYDQFNIDPHTLSAIWYGLDNYHVADVKAQLRNSKKGAA